MTLTPGRGAITLLRDRIVISFPFDLATVEFVKTNVPDRMWNHKTHPKVWSAPASPWHCAKVIEAMKPLHFHVDPKIEKCANAQVSRPNIRKQLPEALYGYQKEGVEFIHAAHGRALIGDDMGLGKSAEALVWSDLFGGDKILIVSPANVIWKWALKEVKMWAAGRTWQVVDNGKQTIGDSEIIIMSYGVMVSLYEQLNVIPFDTMIFDEAHYLKSASKRKGSQRGRVAKKLIKGVPNVLFLTGTAFKNKRIEMYPLLNMLNPQVWSNVIEFGTRYCGGIFQHGSWIVPPDRETNTEELQARLAPIMLRRTKKQVAIDLPDLTRVSIPITIDNAKEYEQTLRSVKEQARTEGYKPALALTLLNKLRQVVGMGKTSAAIELAEDILETGNKLVIHAHHKAVIKEIVDGLVKILPASMIGVIDGSTAPKERQELASAFMGTETPASLKRARHIQVMVVSSAGKEGIDLYSANHVVFVERQWTPADEEQIEARLHRNGQKNAVTAHYLVAQGTVDERLDEIVRSKRAEFANLIDTDIIREVYLSTFE